MPESFRGRLLLRRRQKRGGLSHRDRLGDQTIGGGFPAVTRKAATWDIFLTLRRESDVAVRQFKPLMRREIGAFPAIIACHAEWDLFEWPLPRRATGFDGIAARGFGLIIGVFISYRTIDVNEIPLDNK